MTRKNQGSRLSETSFSKYNLREAYVDNSVEYIASLRDEIIFSNYGIKVLIKIPADENDNYDENAVDEYSNFVTRNWIDTTECVVPKFTEYRQNVSENGMSADGTDGIYPLEVVIPTKLHLPRDSRIIFSEYDSKENMIVREWTVLGTQMKQLSGTKTYTRVAECVPSRQEVFNGINTELSTIWFDYLQSDIFKDNLLKAQGTIWFVNQLCDRALVKRSIKDEIFEVPDENIEYAEEIVEPMYYDFRQSTIVDSGRNFTVGDSFEVTDASGNPVYIDVTEDGKQEELILTVVDVDRNGSILKYSLNVEKGYSYFSDNGKLIFSFGKDIFNSATVEIKSVDLYSTDYQEDIADIDIPSPKYIEPCHLDFAIVANPTMASVLN